MKTSELIRKLKGLKEKYGDMPVVMGPACFDDDRARDVGEVAIEGMLSKTGEPQVVRFCLEGK